MQRFALLLALILASACMAAPAPEPIRNVRWLPPTEIEKAALANPAGKLHDLPLWFTPYNTLRPRVPERHEVFGDRKVYLADDPVGQFLVYFTGADLSDPNTKLTIELLKGDSNKPVLTKQFTPVPQPKVAFLLDTGSLPVGNYRMRATLSGKTSLTIPAYAFTKSADHHRKVDFPADGVPLMVHTQSIVPNAEWPITTGIPLPRATADRADQFVLLEDGQPVPAQFSTRATWCPDGTQIKWMGLDFIARYQNGKPREYRLTLPKNKTSAAVPATTLKVTQTPGAFTVDTGKIRFTVNRNSFAGISQAWLTNPDGTTSAPLISTNGGPYLVDERGMLYEAANDEAVRVELVEQGPVRATIYATGWYVNKPGAEKLCQFRTQISAFAGQDNIDILHRTIITYDTDKEKLADLGFAIHTTAVGQYQFGVDSQVVAGALPVAAMDPATKKPLPIESVWLHQDRWNHCRLMGEDKKLKEGKKSDGWATVSGTNGAVGVVLRNIWQLYPKELELAGDAVTVHFWPKHGTNTFTESEELDHHNLYKFFYCHEGQFLDLKFPQNYYAAAGAMSEQQNVNAAAAQGQGLAISSEFRIALQQQLPAGPAAQDAALYQKNPHAIADPAWNAKSEAEGRFAAMDRKRFGNVEKALDEGYRSNTTTPDILEEYGMWIWPDTHNNWSPVSRLPEWHRIWNNSHYQNVWESWLLYLRSGLPWTIDWARANTAHYMDVGTVNYDDPNHKLLGHMKGAMYHVKGLLPWGSPIADQECGDDYVEVGAHFIDPDAFMISYLMMGDPRGYELMHAWADALGRAALPPERSREQAVTIGETLSYYTTTWDPQFILYNSDLASEYFDRPCKENFFGFYHSQYLRRYWELTRDPLLPAWTKAAWGDMTAYQVAPLMYEWTGDKKYLQEMLPHISTCWEWYYSNPADPLNGYGPRLGDLGSARFAQRAPYFLQACIDAGIESIPSDESLATPVAVRSIAKEKPGAWIGSPTTYAGPAYAYVLPTGAQPVVTLEFTATVMTANNSMTGTSYVRVENAEGKVLLESTLLGGSLRPSVSVTLDSRTDKGPWKVHINGYTPLMKWTGTAEGLVVGPTAAEVKATPKT